MRKISFVTGEHYHIYNRGIDKRDIFSYQRDVSRFLKSMVAFNVLEPIGSIYEDSFNQLGGSASKRNKLIEFVAYCLNPSHYHFVVRQIAEKGIEKFMHRLGTGYTMHFNEKEKRSGSLFQGRFKAVHIDSNEYLLHVSAYVNLNDRVHKLGGSASKLIESRSSWGEYTNPEVRGICQKEIVLEQFRNPNEYKEFALSSLESIKQRKEELEDIREFLLESNE